jgi:hypothetical protein
MAAQTEQTAQREGLGALGDAALLECGEAVYDEAIFLQSQRRRRATLGADMASATAGGWKKISPGGSVPQASRPGLLSFALTG